MKVIFKYGFVFLAVLFLSSLLVKAQEDVRRRNIIELRQLEKGYVEVDEIDPLMMREIPKVPEVMVLSFNGNSNMRISKRVDELSRSKKFTFNVEKGYSDIYFRLTGKANEGSIKIKLIQPDSKVLKEVIIVSGQDQNWQQTYSLVEKENPGFIGKWSVELSCKEASGFYQFIFSSR